ncbi:MAG: hypothetical protein JXA73_08215 [Acidobacteria bacterium]|nr:hypothetical protein [Acidobacteriota bacterium]
MIINNLRRSDPVIAAMVVVACMGLMACGTDSPSGKQRVEIWRGGDDVLTMQLKDAVESAFRASPDFALSSGKKPGTLMVMIPSRAKFKQVGLRKQVLFDATFSNVEGKNLAASTGACWDDSLVTCALQIVKDAKSAARKIR